MGAHHKAVGIITLCVIVLLPGKLSAQDEGIQSETLRVGVVELERFAMKAVRRTRRQEGSELRDTLPRARALLRSVPCREEKRFE